MDDITQILSSLNGDDIETLKGLANSILGENSSDGQNTKKSGDSDLGGLNLDGDMLQMILKAKSAFENMNGGSSPNADLILALKPHLSEGKRERADQAVQMMKMLDMLPLLKDLF